MKLTFSANSLLYGNDSIYENISTKIRIFIGSLVFTTYSSACASTNDIINVEIII